MVNVLGSAAWKWLSDVRVRVRVRVSVRVWGRVSVRVGVRIGRLEVA